MCLSAACQLEFQCQSGSADATIGIFASAIPLVMGIDFVVKYLYSLFWGFQVGRSQVSEILCQKM